MANETLASKISDVFDIIRSFNLRSWLSSMSSIERNIVGGIFLYEAATTFFFVSIFIWILNRYTHIKPTKGTHVDYLDSSNSDDEENEDDGFDDEDESDSKYDGDYPFRSDAVKRRQSKLSTVLKKSQMIQQTMLGYSPEKDDSEDETDEDYYIDEHSDDDSGDDHDRVTKDDKKKAVALKTFGESIKKLKVFSYLSKEAQMVVVDNVEYVNLDANEHLFERNEYDGSLYAVMMGEVKVKFHDYMLNEDERDSCGMDEDDHMLTLLKSEDDIVTPPLAMLTGLISEETDKKSVAFADGISAVATCDGTRLLRVPPKCFISVLHKFPEELHRIAQVTLSRFQRLSVLTLVTTLGLRRELIQEATKLPKKEKNYDLEGLCSSKDTNVLKEEAVKMAMQSFGMDEDNDSPIVTMLKEKSSVVTEDSRVTFLSTGNQYNEVRLLVKGKVEVGILTPSSNTCWSFQLFETLSIGDWVGIAPCFLGVASLFTYRCGTGGCTFLQIPKQTFEQILIGHPRVMSQCISSIVKITPPVAHLLNWNTDWIELEAADSVVEYGEPTDSIYFVINGRLRANYIKSKVTPRTSSSYHPRFRRKTTGEMQEEFGRGKCVGDIAVLARSKWPCEIYAIRHSDVVKISMRTLAVILRSYPNAGLNFARTIAKQIRSNSDEDNSKGSVKRNSINPALGMPSYGFNMATIAVVPLSNEVIIDDFCVHIAQSLKAMAPTKLLTKKYLSKEIGEKRHFHNRFDKMSLKINRFKIIQSLADVEESNRLVVYQADQKFTWWSKLCIQQADVILLVVDAATAPKKNRVEQLLAWAYESMRVRIEIVIIRRHQSNIVGKKPSKKRDAADSTSNELNDWIEERPWITNHHLIRMPYQENQLDFQRMCRRITGRSIGLVLGGGGARGLAHVGVIRALEEAGVKVDMVGGTSQGAFAGALYAMYPDDFDKFLKESRSNADSFNSKWEKISDLTLPITSIFSAIRFNKGIKDSLGSTRRIQDLLLSYYCVSVDLQRRKEVIHTKGSLWKYVRASMSLTGYLPPISEDGMLLIDGGYLNVCPADVMKQKFGVDKVISVEVADESQIDYYNYGVTLSGWWLLWNSWNPFVKTVKVPSMGDIQNMTIWVASEQHRIKNVIPNSQLHLTPPVKGVSTLDYHRFDEVVEAGYHYAKPIIDKWVKENPSVVSKVVFDK